MVYSAHYHDLWAVLPCDFFSRALPEISRQASGERVQLFYNLEPPLLSYGIPNPQSIDVLKCAYPVTDWSILSSGNLAMVRTVIRKFANTSAIL